MTCRPLAGARLLTAWNLLWWKQRTGILSQAGGGSEGNHSATTCNQREGGGGSPCPATPGAAGHQPPAPRPGWGIVGSSGSQVAGPGHFMGFCPEKQGLGTSTTPAGLESKREEAWLQPPRGPPVLYAGHVLPPRMEHGPPLLGAGDSQQQFS